MTRSRRRLAVVAALGALVVGVLAGCRSEGGSAAWVGDTQITNDQVNAIAAAVPAGYSDLANARYSVVNLLVFNTAVRKYAATTGIAAPAVNDASRASTANNMNTEAQKQVFANQQQVDAARPYLDVRAEAVEWLALLMSKQPGTMPSDADLMRLYNELKADFRPGTTFEQAKQALLQVPNLAQGVALRNSIEPTFKSYDISINPRYANNCAKAPCSGPYVPLVQFQGIDVVNLPLTSAQPSPPALDLPAAVQNVPGQG